MQKSQFIAHCKFEIGDIVKINLKEYKEDNKYIITDILTEHSLLNKKVTFNICIANMHTNKKLIMSEDKLVLLNSHNDTIEEGIVLKNIDLSNVSIREEILKLGEEIREFIEALG